MIRITDIQEMERPRLSLLTVDQQHALAALIGYAEGIAGSGVLPPISEMALRQVAVNACNAFGMPTKAERAKESA